jgi:hypothetical protein
MYNTNEIKDFIVDRQIATKEELQLVTDINGYNNKTLNQVLFARTGYRSIELMKEAEEK